jgi:hypothetical protein
MTISVLKLGAALLLGVSAVCFLPAHDESAPGIDRPPLHWSTAVERQESLAAMRRAWVRRDRTASPANGVEERRFIFRLNFFTRYVRDTETFRDASALLVNTYWENAAVYGEINRR